MEFKKEDIIFDLDGTLLDPRIAMEQSARYALTQMGITADKGDLVKIFMGPPLLDTFKNVYGLSQSDALIAQGYFRKYYQEFGYKEDQLYPGVAELLAEITVEIADEIGDTRRKLFIATQKSQLSVDLVANHLDISRFFQLILGTNEHMHSKVEVVRTILESTQTKAIMVGDRAQDIEAARINGIKSIAVSYGVGDLEELKNAKPTMIVHSVEELRRVILV